VTGAERDDSPVLLDVSLLVALAWPQHVLSGEAHRWFRGASRREWATTAVTEAGLARLSMNPSLVGQVPGWPAVVALVARLRQVRGHRRWGSDVDLVADPVVARARIVGHRQVSDVLLVAAAARHGGRLATLDQGLASALHPDDRHLVELVPAV